jgi:ankyrin repeat protein
MNEAIRSYNVSLIEQLLVDGVASIHDTYVEPSEERRARRQHREPKRTHILCLALSGGARANEKAQQDALDALLRNANERVAGEHVRAAMELAAKAGRHGALSLLLEYAASSSEEEDGSAFLWAKNDDGNTLMHLAALRCTSQCVDVLLTRCPRRDDVLLVANRFGATVLHKIAGVPENDESLRCAELLLARLADDDLLAKALAVRDDERDTPLMKAIRRRSPRLVGLLRQRATDANGDNDDDEAQLTPLHVAAACHWHALVQSLLDDDQCDVNALDHCGHSPLAHALRGDNQPTLFNANVLRIDAAASSSSSSSCAMEIDQEATLRVLFERGANADGQALLHMPTMSGQSIALLLSCCADKAVAARLVADVADDGLLPLDRAMGRSDVGRVGACAALLRAGAPANKLLLLTKHATSLLHALSGQWQYVDCVAPLVAMGVPVDAERAELHGRATVAAVESDIDDTVARLVELGARVDRALLDAVVDHFAAQSLAVLVATAVDIASDDAELAARVRNARNDDGESLLHAAVACNRPALARALTRPPFAIDVDLLPDTDLDNAFSDYGTPLHSAAQKGCAACAEQLIDAGADINSQRNYYRNAPAHLAARYDNVDVLAALIKAGAALDVRNKYDETVADVAEENSPESLALVKAKRVKEEEQ